MGLTKADIARVRAQIAKTSASAVAGAVGPKLAPAALTAVDRAAAKLLRAVAARLDAR
jgi:hypothetical protein